MWPRVGIYLTPRFPRNKVFISASCDRGLPLRAAALASTDPRGGSESAPPTTGAVTSVRALQEVNPLYLRGGGGGAAERPRVVLLPPGTRKGVAQRRAKKNRRGAETRKGSATFCSGVRALYEPPGRRRQPPACLLRFRVDFLVCFCAENSAEALITANEPLHLFVLSLNL